MKLSEIATQTELQAAWAVEADADIYQPPAGLKRISFLWQGREDKPQEISEQLIDTIVCFTLADVEVIVEIRPTDDVDFETLLIHSENAGFSISLAPPESEDDLSRWFTQGRRATRAFLASSDFSNHLYPLTGYITYLILELFTGIDTLDPNDDYVRDRFVTPVPEEWSNRLKAELRAEMISILGSEEALRQYFGALVKALTEAARKQVIKDLRQLRPH